MVDLSVDLGGLKMRTPVATASGTFGYGSEYVGALDYAKLGAVTAKAVTQSGLVFEDYLKTLESE